MPRKQKLTKIQINGETFFIDHTHEFVCDLVSEKFKKPAALIDEFFFQDPKAAQKLIDAAVMDGCADDVAMTYFLSMALQNYGQIARAGLLVTQMYNKHSSNLLAKCAYANHLMFHTKIDEMPAVFNNDFDLTKITTERTLPLPVFVQFMSFACDYYYINNDLNNLHNKLVHLLDGAPKHEATQRFLEMSKHLVEARIDEIDIPFVQALNMAVNKRRSKRKKSKNTAAAKCESSS